MTVSEFTIDKVSWHTSVQGNPEERSQIEHRFRCLFVFLTEHNLLSDTAPALSEEPIPDDFALHSSHLNELGMIVIKTGYDRWLKSIDSGTSPEKAKALSEALKKAINSGA